MSNERKAHAFPNDFGIPPSKMFEVIDKDSNRGGNLVLSRIFPFNWFSERSNLFKAENIERSGSVPLIWFPLKFNSWSENLAHPDSHWSIVDDVKLFQVRSRMERELEKLNLEGFNERIKWSERLQWIKLSSLSFGSLAIIWRKLWEVLRLDIETKERWVKEMRLDSQWSPSSILRAPP